MQEKFIEDEKVLFQVTSNACIARGALLNHVSNLEIMLDIFLSYHFCKTRELQKEFLTFILPSDTTIFEKKRIVFKKIVERHYPKFKIAEPNYYKILETIREYRNKFAHYPLDITPKGIEIYVQTKSIVLLDNTKKRVVFTQMEVEDISKQIVDLRSKIVAHIPK